MVLSHDSNIVARAIAPDEGNLTAELSQILLQLLFSEEDHDWMSVLAGKTRSGSLTPDEAAEHDSFDRIGTFLSLLKSKARQSLNG